MPFLPCRERGNADSFVIEQPCSCQYSLFSNQLLGGLTALVWRRQAAPAFSTWLSGELLWSTGQCIFKFSLFLSSALASKLCLKPAELNLPRLTTVYAGFSYITAVAAFHTVLIQTRCSKRPGESSLPLAAPRG